MFSADCRAAVDDGAEARTGLYALGVNDLPARYLRPGAEKPRL